MTRLSKLIHWPQTLHIAVNSDGDFYLLSTHHVQIKPTLNIEYILSEKLLETSYKP